MNIGDFHFERLSQVKFIIQIGILQYLVLLENGDYIDF